MSMFSLQSLRFGLRQSHRQLSTLTIQTPTLGQKNLALPIVFLNVRKWDSIPGAAVIWKEWSKRFSDKGYTSFFVDLDDRHSMHESESTKEMLEALELELKAILSSSPSPFPPLLISKSLSTLLAETYVSSHPLSALLLHSPPTPQTISTLHETRPELFHTKVTEFDYEPRFSIAVMHDKIDSKREIGRLEQEFMSDQGDDDSSVSVLTGSIDTEEGWKVAMDWMDDNGL